jgi:hypothetical protein
MSRPQAVKTNISTPAVRSATHDAQHYLKLIDHRTKYRSPMEQEFIDKLFAKLARGDLASLEHSLRSRAASALRRRKVLAVERMQ